MPNPKYKITNFTKDNIYWLKGMNVEEVGGSNIINTGYNNYKYVDKDTSGCSTLSTLENPTGATDIAETANSLYRKLVLIQTTKIYINGQNPNGLMHTLSNTGSSYADIRSLPSENIIYTGSQYIGIAYMFTATGGSATSFVVSTQDFSALGVSSSAGHNKVYDLNLGQEFTVTGLSDSNHQIDVTAVSGKVPAIAHRFLVFNDVKYDMTTDSNTYVRQIERLDDRTFILNGNYLAMLSADETTLTDDYQQFPAGVIGTCFGVNNDLMLIGGRNQNNIGVIMVYDGFSSYFKSITYNNSIPKSIIPYKNGWIIFFEDGEIRYTDGVSFEIIANLPDSNTYKQNISLSFRSCILYDNKLFVSCERSYYNRSIRSEGGIHIYDLKNGVWSFLPARGYYGFNYVAPRCLYLIVEQTGIVGTIRYGKQATIQEIITDEYTTERDVFLDITLPQKTNIRKVELNLGFNYRAPYYVGIGGTSTVSLSSGDGRYGIYSRNTITDASTKTNLIPNTIKGTGFVGQEIIVYGSSETDSVNGEEYTYITEITDNGGSNESWTVSPALTSDIGTSTQQVGQLGFRLSEVKTITHSTMNKDCVFDIKDHYGDKLYLHIRIKGLLDLRGINVW